MQVSSFRKVKQISRIKSLYVPSVFRNKSILINVQKDHRIEIEPIKSNNDIVDASLPSRKRKRTEDDLAVLTKMLLKKRLVECKGNQLKEVYSDELLNGDEIVIRKSFILNEPYKYYWFLHGEFYKTVRPGSFENFDYISHQMFPNSFLWLLKECSRTINVNPRDLYYEVVNTELLLSKVNK